MPTPNEAPCIYPSFHYQDAAAMIAWLGAAFGFSVRACYEDGGIVHHAELVLGSSMIMVGSARDDAYGKLVGQPGNNGGKSLYIAVADADAAYARAKAAGASIRQEPVDRDYGSREFICSDPEGNIWSVGTYWPKVGEPA